MIVDVHIAGRQFLGDRELQEDDYAFSVFDDPVGRDGGLLMVLADGMTRGSVDALTKSVASVEATGTTVIGIGIGDHTVDEADPHETKNLVGDSDYGRGLNKMRDRCDELRAAVTPAEASP